MTHEHAFPKDQKNVFVVIHGHFYQPPRENPWMQAIPQQDSASPHHDWNERITAECYKPNTRARVLDHNSHIIKLQNNFEHLNFNIGPTLFLWLKEHAPEVFHKLVEADKLSCERYNGHGNAIAQVYNHVILPLASPRDKVTQIMWGVREFQHRFGRPPESIWLAETGINEDTVNCLIEQGLKYVILSPTQAQRVRKFHDETWRDVSDNSIDTAQPYRLFKKEVIRIDPPAPDAQTDDGTPQTPQQPTYEVRYHPDQYIDAFFYDGGLSAELSFNHLLRDINVFTKRIQDVAAKSSAPRVLVHIATDGEIYGHHEAFGDMSLAAMLTKTLPEAQIEVTNYGRFLEMCPPTMQAELKPGSESGEGTAWSCAHGVGRWYRDCGCATDSPAGWNQAWRTPLREAFDRLRDGLADLFEQRGRGLLRDPWAARNDYIDCILDPTEQTFWKFFERHASHPLNEEEQSIVLRLLESQKYAMFAYTSCGWFFNDVSGLEPVQNMRYAARAIQLVDGMIGYDIESQMLELLEKAVSNMPQFGTGKSMYLKYVKPEVYTAERAANQLLLTTLIRHPASSKTATGSPAQWLTGQADHRIHIYALRCPKATTWQDLLKLPPKGKNGDAPLPQSHPELIISGMLEVKDTITRQGWKILFTSFNEQSGHPVSYIKRIHSDQECDQFLGTIPQQMGGERALDPKNVTRFLEEAGLKRYTLSDFYYDDRQQVFSKVLQEYTHHVENHIETVYTETVDLLDSLIKASLQVPSKHNASVEFALTYHAMIEMERLYAKPVGEYSPALLKAGLEKVLHLSAVHHLSLDMDLLRKRLTDALGQYVTRLSQRFVALQQAGHDPLGDKIWEDFLGLLRATLDLLDQGEKMGVKIEKTEIQNMAYDILEDTVPRYLAMFKTALQNAGKTENEGANHELHRFFKEYQFLRECLKLAQRLNFNIEHYRNVLISAELGVF